MLPSNDLHQEPVLPLTPRLHPAKLGTSTIPLKSFVARKNKLKRLGIFAKGALRLTELPHRGVPLTLDILHSINSTSNTNNTNNTTLRTMGVTTHNSLITPTNNTLNNRAQVDKPVVKQVA